MVTPEENRKRIACANIEEKDIFENLRAKIYTLETGPRLNTR